MTMQTGGTIAIQYQFKVKVVGDHVVIDGTNGGNIRGKGGRGVRFESASGVPFSIKCTEFLDNDGGTPADAWPFQGAPPPNPMTFFEGALIKPEKGAALLIFKYTIEIEGKHPADPAIIIDH